jgi:hypothetical protein
MSAGYSGRPLVQKLGIREGDALALLNAPDGYERLLGKMPEGATVARDVKGRFDMIQLFATERATLEIEFPRSKASLKQGGAIWVSWPKASSGLQTDLSDGVVREVGLNNGLVDVKVCAVDGSWSALKFVRRLTDRGDNSRRRNRKA